MPQTECKNSKRVIVNWKPTSYIQPHTSYCALCYASYTKDVSIVECSVCHQHLHSECQLNWSITNIFNDAEPTCPFCRSVWKSNEYILYPILDNEI